MSVMISYNPDTIRDLIRNGEGSTIEFKKSFADTNAIMETICAFANTRGGKILIGVSDSGEIIGVEIRGRELERIENEIYGTFEPRVYVSINRGIIDGKMVVIIDVPEGEAKPYFYRGKAYVRIGKANRIAGREKLLDILKRSFTFDGLKLDEEVNIREDIVRMVLEKAQKRRGMSISSGDISMILKKLGVYGKRAMALLFSDDPIFPQASIRCGFFHEGELIDDELIRGNLFDQVKHAVNFIKRNMRKRFIIEGLERKEVWEYPIEAIREVIVNAVLHRDYFRPTPIYVKMYDDRIEVINPGELPPPLTIEDLRREHLSVPRNPLLADVFYLCGLFEKWGFGTLLIINSCVNHGLPEPKFISEGGFFRVIIRKKESSLRDLSKNVRALYEFIKAKEKVSFRECVEFLKKSEKTAQRYLNKLIDLGLVEKVEKGVYRVVA